jgi:uncharacterized protein (DUF488 family)
MPTLYTIGHSTRPLAVFIEILQAYNITHLIDIRTIPKSRRVPWFNEASLKKALNKAGIRYLHMAELGGLRHAHKDSINQGWYNASFRGFADYMQQPEFYTGLKKLNALLTRHHHVAIMCAEAVPWRCHRSLIGDAELIRGIHVINIFSATSHHPHELTAFAKVDRTKRPIKIWYPTQNST